jgi:hypothetical protein
LVGDHVDPLPLLALLQHNGAATPLVDVTTDPTVAMYYAAQPAPMDGRETDGVLLAIDVRPTALGPWPRRAIHFDVGEDRSWPDVLSHLTDENVPLGVYTPPMITSRIMAQRRRFIFGAEAAGVTHSTLPLWNQPTWSDEQLRQLFGHGTYGRVSVPPVVGILIRAGNKARLREVLARTYGITAETLFPDLPGFAAAHGASADLLT